MARFAIQITPDTLSLCEYIVKDKLPGLRSSDRGYLFLETEPDKRVKYWWGVTPTKSIEESTDITVLDQKE